MSSKNKIRSVKRKQGIKNLKLIKLQLIAKSYASKKKLHNYIERTYGRFANVNHLGPEHNSR